MFSGWTRYILIDGKPGMNYLESLLEKSSLMFSVVYKTLIYAVIFPTAYIINTRIIVVLFYSNNKLQFLHLVFIQGLGHGFGKFCAVSVTIKSGPQP